MEAGAASGDPQFHEHRIIAPVAALLKKRLQRAFHFAAYCASGYFCLAQ